LDGLRITNMTRSKIHRVAVLAMHGVVPFDLGIPCETFGRLKIANRNAYRVRVCGEARHVKAGFFDLRAQWDLSDLLDADTIVVPGLADIAAPISREVVSALRAAKRRGIRVASICTGAFVLAAAGLLDGRRATTHWLAAPALAARFPAVEIDANVLYVDNEDILTSAGAAAGLDMCLHIVRRDFGASAAANAARLSVMPLERAGGQAQFIVHETPASVTTLARAALDGGAYRRVFDSRGYRKQSRHERADAEPAFPRADRNNPGAVGRPRADLPRATLTRNDRFLRRARRIGGRFRIGLVVPRALRASATREPGIVPSSFSQRRPHPCRSDGFVMRNIRRR